MLLIRKLSRSIKKDPLLSWQSPLADECIIGRAAIRQCPRAYECHRSVRSLFDVERDGFASRLIRSGVNRHCVASFSSFVETVLVQARDPAKLSSELVTAIDEGRHDDAWKLYELHMQMDGFPRKSVVHKLIVSLTETLDVQWLNRAYGLVERAFEEGKQNLFEKETLIYLSFGLAKGGLPVAASTILRKLVDMEGYPPVAAWSAILAYTSQLIIGRSPLGHMSSMSGT